jgi:hypothetical protein
MFLVLNFIVDANSISPRSLVTNLLIYQEPSVSDPGVYLDADQDPNPESRVNGYPGGYGARYHVYALVLGQLLRAPDPYPNSQDGSGSKIVIIEGDSCGSGSETLQGVLD